MCEAFCIWSEWFLVHLPLSLNSLFSVLFSVLDYFFFSIRFCLDLMTSAWKILECFITGQFLWSFPEFSVSCHVLILAVWSLTVPKLTHQFKSDIISSIMLTLLEYSSDNFTVLSLCCKSNSLVILRLQGPRM